MALIDAAKTIAGAASLMLGIGSPALAQQRPPSVFTVSNVKAEAEAANAVEAKKLATATAETRAFRKLVSRLVDYRAQSRIPEIPANEVERLVSDIDVRGEGVSGTSYVAMFGVSFSERAIAALFSQYGVIPITDRAPEILIVPVYIEEGAARTTDRNPWRTALLQLDLTHALVPAKVAPARGDLTAAIANAYLANPTSGVETLKTQYHATQLLFAVAELESGGEALSVKLIGTDALGAFSIDRKVKAKDGVDEPLIATAAQLAFDAVQERWKLTRDAFVDANAQAGSPSSQGAYTGGGGGLQPVQITAQFSGLKEWQSIRTRLQGVPGVQNWDLRSVNPRSAEIGFDFPGGAERLTALAAGQGLSVENGPEGLVVKTR